MVSWRFSSCLMRSTNSAMKQTSAGRCSAYLQANTIRSVTPWSLGAVNEAAGVEKAHGVLEGREGVADAFRVHAQRKALDREGPGA